MSASAKRLRQLSALTSIMERECAEQIDAAARVVVDTLRRGGTVYVCGNGGSMSQAQHFAAELTGRYRTERRPLPCIALGSNPAHLTAVSNDYGYRLSFARELEAFAKPDDCLVCLSTSGQSENVIEAAVGAGGLGVSVVAIVGANAPRVGRGAVRIPSTDTALIQEATIHVLHSIAEAVDEALS